MDIPVDFATLRVIWWALVGILLIGFALTDGFDMGVGALLPFVAKTDKERRMVINTIGATWEGNQVWFILGGGAIFAAWPFVYAISFSGFYLAMFTVLAAMILRPVGFKYRSKRPDPRWRSFWDWALFIGGFVPVLCFGVALGNVLQGAPFRLNDDLRAFYDGSFLGLFSPFALLCGLRGVSFGDSLIKHVVETLTQEFPRLRTFATLSPIPGFRAWLSKNAGAMLDRLDDKRRSELGRAVGFEPPQATHFLAAVDKPLDLDAKSPVRQMLLECAAHYLAREMVDGKPVDAVARFHLGNGARVERLNWAGDPSAKGLKQSYGLMVNYLYDLKRIDKHRSLLAQGKVPASGDIDSLCRH